MIWPRAGAFGGTVISWPFTLLSSMASLWFPCSQGPLDEVEEFSTRLASTGIEELKLAFVQEAKDEGINLCDYVYRRIALSALAS